MNISKNKGNLFDSAIKSGIYVITCVPAKKYYIGQSSAVTRRLNAHKSKLRRGCHENRFMQKDFNLYGEDSFLFQKLYFGAGLPKSDLEKLETNILATLDEKNRYNFFVDWHKRGALSNPFYGKTHTAEARKAQSDAKMSKPSNFAGRKQSDFVKQKVSQENSGKKVRNKPVCVDSVWYPSMAEASRKTGLARRLIRERCHSEEERFNNYRWADIDDANGAPPSEE